MNILVPDQWLRDFLKTKATPKQIKEYVSLCGMSVERINVVGKDIVYDIEVTSNRPDAMSVVGIAREASVILPKFGIDAELVGDPYKTTQTNPKTKDVYKLNIQSDKTINPRFTALVIDDIKNTSSPEWMEKYLTLSGMRPINAVVDITNYLMKAYGQPVHAFDYDQILPNKKGIPTMILRESKKGEKITTLDGKTHTLPGGDIVIEDGSERLIDLCGIMGGGVSHITEKTTRVLLFVQTYDPTHIRKTSMALAHRTDAAALFEKGLDTELVMPTIFKGISLLEELTKGKPASLLYDVYPHPFTPPTVTLKRDKLDIYLGIHLTNDEITDTLESLGFSVTLDETILTVTVPSYRRDVTIDVDVVEEIARIYGYHNIQTKLPDSEPPMTFEDPHLGVELKLKHKLADWGYTETYTYSMISKNLMDVFGFNTKHAYTISNPLSDEWVYMRPSLLPSMLSIMKENLHIDPSCLLFELSHVYDRKKGDLPHEHPFLIVASAGSHYQNLKGLSEAIFSFFGIPKPKETIPTNPYYNPEKSLALGEYGVVGEIESTLLSDLGIETPITVLEIDVERCYANLNTVKKYHPIPKFPASFEDIAFVVPPGFHVGPLIDAVKQSDPLISDVSLLDSFKNTRTLHITYQSADKNLTTEDTLPIRKKILKLGEEKFACKLKS